MNKKWVFSTLASAVLLASSCQLLAQAADCDDPTVTDVVVEEQINMGSEPVELGLESQSTIEPELVPEEQNAVEAPEFIVLSDKIHQIQEVLENARSVHHYSFTSIRGQDVLLGTPEPKMLNQLWKVEYQVNGSDWKVKAVSFPEAFRGLDAGSVVNIRVSAVEGAQVENAAYSVVLGSYPWRDYNLHHEDGLLRIPYGTPTLLVTQAIEKALLEVKFWDSKGAPLEGGVLKLDFNHHGTGSRDPIFLISGSDGKASKLLEFGKCEGGDLANNFTQKIDKNRATWATRYKVGFYTGANVLLGELADSLHSHGFGHICKRFLVNWERY
ncbi:hypothetical protein [Pseudomonas caspiana]|uniref:Uncharacterized protein n=1 Tax=Pseudomonas caspiana TaxID=1451454 RepID=A0A1Y3P5Z8_9PSED|nr:hypothetical protein [Pseudomonas caspiana]OUM75228.1 hypothetical protein AUC60_03235 [Pseudomonas caspiana]